MFTAIDSSQLTQIVGGLSAAHGVASVDSYMETERDGSGAGLSADARRNDFISKMQSRDPRVREAAQGSFTGMQAAIGDRDVPSTARAGLALRHCGLRPGLGL